MRCGRARGGILWRAVVIAALLASAGCQGETGSTRNPEPSPPGSKEQAASRDETTPPSGAARPADRTAPSGTAPPSGESPLSANPRPSGQARDYYGKSVASAQSVDYTQVFARFVPLFSLADPGAFSENDYVRVVRSGEYVVSTKEELLAALDQARDGEVVYIKDGARINLSGEREIEIGAGVTLAGRRGDPGRQETMLYTSDPDAVLFVMKKGARLTGLELMGPDPDRRSYQLERLSLEGGSDLYYMVPISTGVRSESPNIEIDNCELWGWSFAAVELRRGAHGAKIRFNCIHHNQRRLLGYGVYLDEADALIQANLFDWCRHAIAGSGRPGTAYEASYNAVLSNSNGHSFDMHGGEDRGDGTNVAGDWMRIHHNVFAGVDFPGIEVRGLPRESIEIHDNRFRHETEDQAIRLRAGTERIEVRDNIFGGGS